MPQALSSPFSNGQSEIRSPPSFMFSDSKVGLTIEPESRLSRENATGPLTSPFLMSIVDGEAELLALPEAHVADSRRERLDGQVLAGQPDPARDQESSANSLEAEIVEAARGRRPRRRCRSSGTDRGPRRRAAGCTRRRMPGIVIASSAGKPASRHSLRMLVPYSKVGTPASKKRIMAASWRFMVSRALRRYSVAVRLAGEPRPASGV